MIFLARTGSMTIRPDSSRTSTGSSKHRFAAFKTVAGIRTEALLPHFLTTALMLRVLLVSTLYLHYVMPVSACLRWIHALPQNSRPSSSRSKLQWVRSRAMDVGHRQRRGRDGDVTASTGNWALFPPLDDGVGKRQTQNVPIAPLSARPESWQIVGKWLFERQCANRQKGE
jgi:hypothetical protein